MLQYQFDIHLAKDYGVPEAIFVHRLYWLVGNNAANNRNLKDGHYWTYDTQKALLGVFPFWTKKQLRTIISHCRDKGLILTANYNEDKTDKTTWYTVTDKVNFYYRLPQNTQQIPTKQPEEVPVSPCAQMGTCKSPNGHIDVPKRAHVYNDQLEDQLEEERNRKKEKEAEEPKQTYGEFGNVHLTKTEMDKLLARWTSQQVHNTIEDLSAYQRSKGKSYNDHYATLLGWLRRDCPEGQTTGGGRVLIDDD